MAPIVPVPNDALMADRAPRDPGASALLTDLYQLTMLKSYFELGMGGTAVFEFFVRKLPPERNFLLAAGLEQALEYLENLCFSPQELAWLAARPGFDARFIDWLGGLRFSGDVDAMPEGTPFFADQPVLRVAAPLPQAQLVETRLVALMHFSCLIASKAARCVLAAPGKLLVDFGLRARTARKPACSRRAQPTWRVSAARRPCLPASASAFRSTAPWRTPTSRRTTTRAPPWPTSRAVTPTTPPC